MNATPQSIGGKPVTTKLAMRMEDSLQAFAVRAACFIGELEVPFSEEFDGHDYGATHIIAYVGAEPVGTMRVRWYQAFGMPERLAVIQRFRGHNIGRLLLERCCNLAESRGCNVLYSRVLPRYVKYLDKQGWRCLDLEGPGTAANQTVAVVRSVRRAMPRPHLNARDARTLSEQIKLHIPGPGLGATAMAGCNPSDRRGDLLAIARAA
jgi:GNAT superfamily N-acetyltransferase